MDKVNTFVIPVIRPDLIERCLDTLYANTLPNFYVVVIDQTYNGLKLDRDKYPNLTHIRTPKTYIHTTGNLGFAKATNLGISLVTTPYFTMCNDDVEFINRRWWGGVLEAFDRVDAATPDRPCMMVNPGSMKLPDWSVGRPSGDHHYIIPYKENYTDQEYDDLVNKPHYVNEHLTLMPGSVIDGVTMYCSVFKTGMFHEVGYLNEKFYPGGGEDYDYNCRANMAGYRCVGTTMSWVWHHWSMTLSTQDQEKISRLIDADLRWNNNNELWGEGFDIWGVKGMQQKDIPPITIRPL
jgi:GT2 family glycosyltransferase